jgi:hypothetical protein
MANRLGRPSRRIGLVIRAAIALMEDGRYPGPRPHIIFSA